MASQGKKNRKEKKLRQNCINKQYLLIMAYKFNSQTIIIIQREPNCMVGHKFEAMSHHCQIIIIMNGDTTLLNVAWVFYLISQKHININGIMQIIHHLFGPKIFNNLEVKTDVQVHVIRVIQQSD